MLAEAGTEPGVILAEIDPAKVAEPRQRIPALKHGRPFRVEIAAQARPAGRLAHERLRPRPPAALRPARPARFSSRKVCVLKVA